MSVHMALRQRGSCLTPYHNLGVRGGFVASYGILVVVSCLHTGILILPGILQLLYSVLFW